MAKPSIKSNPILYISVTSAEALEPFRFVKASGAYADANELMIGVTEIAWDSGDICSLIAGGTAIVESSEAINAGDWVTSANDGKAKVKDATEQLAGISLTTVGATGYIEVLFFPQFVSL